MQKKIVILLSCALAAGLFLRRSTRAGRPWLRQLQGWQKLCGVIALLLALLILLNPDFLLLGLLGDTTFFDILVLALSVQMFTYSQWAWRWLRHGVIRSWRWLGIPSFCFRYQIYLSAAAIESMISHAQKWMDQISS